ncbi:hypothetical protein ABZ770_40225 [Streptomyces sp. NPDC006654]|uniref:hypothetical protein n=1 Tax=unclassified Streptomyces TaxID=2593676 RepID=UPI0033CEF510
MDHLCRSHAGVVHASDALPTGYADDRVAETATLLVDGTTVAVVDPGMVADRRLILDPLTEHGLAPEDVSTLVTAKEGLVVLTHLWWTADGPTDDPFAPDRDQLRASRRRSSPSARPS